MFLGLSTNGVRDSLHPAVSYSDTMMLKGVAIWMMVVHHCFAVPSWYIETPDFFQDASWIVVGRIAKQCVCLFAFLTGWTYYHHKDKSGRYSFYKIVSFLLLYWCSLALSAAIAFFFCSWRPSSFMDVISEIFPVNDHPLMIFVWYVWYYVLMMLIFPLYYYFETRKAAWLRWGGYAVGGVLLFVLSSQCPIFSNLIWFPFSLFGYLIARWSVLEYIKTLASQVRLGNTIFGSVFVILALFLFRDFHIGEYTGRLPWCFFSPLFLISGLSLLISAMPLPGFRSVMHLFGKHSVNIWFMHGLFFSPETREVVQNVFFVYSNPIILFFTVLITSLVLSFALTPVQNWVIQAFIRRK